jgi:hypothetical protein
MLISSYATMKSYSHVLSFSYVNCLTISIYRPHIIAYQGKIRVPDECHPYPVPSCFLYLPRGVF